MYIAPFEKMKEIYIHYGQKKFDKEKFQPIENLPYWTKPKGGLWASNVNDKYGWKEWNDENHFADCTDENSFKFTLAENANVVVINNLMNLDFCPHTEYYEFPYKYMIDFEEMLSDGVDAVKVNISNDSRLYDALYGWDCDSILIMNPDIVEV